MTSSVVFATKDLRVNGANRATQEFAAGLAERGWDVTLGLINDRWSQWLGYDLRCITIRQALEERYDAGISTFYTTLRSIEEIDCAERWQLIQDNYYRYGARTRSRLDQIEYAYSHRGSRKVVVSRYLQQLLRNKGEESTVVPLGINPAQFFPAPRRNPTGSARVLIEGYSRVYKSLDDCYQAVPQDVEIWGLGIDEHSPRPAVMFCLPKQSELRGIYTECDVLLKLERRAGHPISPLEAMACGRPVVVSDEGGHLDYCIDGFNALIATDAASAKEAVLTLLGNSQTWSRLATNAARFAAEYTWERAVALLDTALTEG